MPQVAVPQPASGVIADLQSMVFDLDHVVRACDRLISSGFADVATYTPESDEELERDRGLLAMALWESAVVSFGRCFATGTGFGAQQRTPIPQDILDELTDEQRAVLKQAKATRNMHVAHRVDDSQRATVVLLLNAPPNPPRAVGVAPFLVHLVVGVDRVEPLRAVAQHLSGRLDDRIGELGMAEIDKANADLRTTYLNATPPLEELMKPLLAARHEDASEESE